ncbi:hypothetical protein RF11_12397 [Thelohanellus kitauei]|uniref:Uncharacterized protein n=1 Tax=Thelohanellus kitauei TaxID=669202 RepID=A0A0C2MN64_THEKT|nr:hypothetical protein RF11_12397 [Thelohanellus kitauei]
MTYILPYLRYEPDAFGLLILSVIYIAEAHPFDSPAIESFPRLSRPCALGNSDGVGDLQDCGDPDNVWYFLSLMRPKISLRPALLAAIVSPAEGQTKATLKPDLEDLIGHPSASVESKGCTSPEGQRAIKICIDPCDLI